ncbi:MAG: hypothetical protein ACRD2A_16710, partial [Vicinamibacterales bacterium]
HDHFLTLAVTYEADAERHVQMGRAYTGNPNRPSGATSFAVHCTQLAKLANESATILRELAAHHERLAAGAPSTVPKNGTRFEEGASAPAPTDTQLRELATSARTPADHRSLEEYYVDLAAKYTSQAEKHVAMAQAYRGTRIAQAAVHCDRLIEASRKAAKQALAAAAEHRQQAGTVR